LEQSKHILVIRFSAMGDVAMTVPVIKNVLQQNPSLQITVVSNAFFEPLFEGLERCHFHPAYLKGKHKGTPGMLRLYNELKKAFKFDAVADLHNVLRSKLLRFFFWFNNIPAAAIDKGRGEKKALTRKENKVLKQLTPMHERYAIVFRNIGIPVTLEQQQAVYIPQPLPARSANYFSGEKKVIGLAPFAQHQEKMYPIKKMKGIVKELATDYTVLLFGGGATEAAVLQQWEDEMWSVKNVAGKFSFKEELAIISNLKLMVSMDSANMHLASLYKVPVVSIWGATHHYAGFYGWAQDEKNIVGIDLYCRPCSVFGNKPCYRGDHACMNRIEEMMITEKIRNVLSNPE
jgi:ADP-heptose:LPS heptosyltransferase